MNLLNMRVSQKDAAVPVLEAARIQNVSRMCQDILKREMASGVMVIQTCHRTEVFAEVSGDSNFERILEVWMDHSRHASFHQYVKTATDLHSVAHLIEVLCGLDSMAVGEPDVYQQVSNGYNLAKQDGFVSERLSRIFESSFRVAKKIRRESGLDEDPVGLGVLTIEFAQNFMGSLKKSKVLVIGTGGAGRQVLQALREVGVRSVFLTGRDPDRTREVALQFGCTPLDYSYRFNALGSVDVVLVATSPQATLIGIDDFRRLRSKNNGGKILVFDMSCPRAVDPGVGNVGGILLANLDYLRELAARHVGNIHNKIHVAEDLVSQEALRIWRIALESEVEPLVASMFRSAETTRKREWQRALKRVGNLPPEISHVLEEMTKSIVEGVVAEAAQQIREAAVTGDKPVMHAARRLLSEVGA